MSREAPVRICEDAWVRFAELLESTPTWEKVLATVPLFETDSVENVDGIEAAYQQPDVRCRKSVSMHISGTRILITRILQWPLITPPYHRPGQRVVGVPQG